MSQDRRPLLSRVAMPHTLVVVMILVIVVLAVSWVIPSGEYQRVKVETSEGSRNVTVAGTYREVPKVLLGPRWCWSPRSRASWTARCSSASC